MEAQKRGEVIMRVIKWKEQEVESAIKWLRDVKVVKDEKLLDAYKAGFENGYMKAFATLQLHGMLKGAC